MISSFASVFETPPPPHTPDQWKLVLQGVKLLYLQHQYKQCAARADELLKTSREPIHVVYKTYLYFYSAISYEVLGRAAHNYSSNKLALLDSALDFFTICSAVLPAPIHPAHDVIVQEEGSSDTSLVDDSSPYDSPDSSFVEGPSTGGGGGLINDLTRIIDYSIGWDEEDPFISDSGVHAGDVDVVPFKLPRQVSNRALLMPSPLQIRKSSGDLGSAYGGMAMDAADQTRPNRSRRPPPLPLKIVPFRDAESPRPFTTNRLNLQEHSEQLHQSSTARYNSRIRFLRSQITSDMASVQALIDEVTERQRTRKASKILRRAASFWSFGPVSKSGADGQVAQESKEQRIARLRAEGWKTVGLQSGRRGWKGAEYYQAYCNSVLEELYLDTA